MRFIFFATVCVLAGCSSALVSGASSDTGSTGGIGTSSNSSSSASSGTTSASTSSSSSGSITGTSSSSSSSSSGSTSASSSSSNSSSSSSGTGTSSSSSSSSSSSGTGTSSSSSSGSTGSTSASSSSNSSSSGGSLATCPTPLPTSDVTSNGHTWALIGSDDFTIDAPLGSFATSSASAIVYTGDHGLGWTEYPDGWPSTYTSGAIGYSPSTVQSVHDGVLDWYLHTENGHPVAANPSPWPGGQQYQTYGRYSLCLRLADAQPSDLTDFYDAFLLWPQTESDWQSAESDYPEGRLDGTHFSAFAHNGGAGAQDAFGTGVLDPTAWHVFTQEWAPGERRYYLDGNLIGSSTQQVYASPERWQLQCEPSGQQTGGSGHQYVDWVAIWSY